MSWPLCKQGFLTSAVMAWLSGVMKPRRPSLITTAKPSSVTQYSMQRMNAPSKSSEGPPVQVQVAVKHAATMLFSFLISCLELPPLFSDLEPTEGPGRRESSSGRWHCVRCCPSRPSATCEGIRRRCTPAGPPGGSADWGKDEGRSSDEESVKETLHRQQQKQKTNVNSVGQQWDESCSSCVALTSRLTEAEARCDDITPWPQPKS